MRGWTDLGREIDGSDIDWFIGEPVVGEPGPFAAGATAYTELADHIVQIGTVFDEYTGSDNPQFQGESARAFNGRAETIREQLTLIPGIAESVSALLSDHDSGLTGLHATGDEALARAWTRWGASFRTLVRRGGDCDAFDLQAADLLAEPDDGQLLRAQDGLADARRELLLSRDEAQDLIDDESALETTTADGLRNVNLGDMADPGFWDKLGGALWDIVLAIPIIGDAIALIDAIIDGDWDRVLWRLRDLLDDVLIVLAVVPLVLAVTFTGGAALAILAIAITKLLIDIGLYATGTEDPDNPGRTIGKFDLALSTLAVVGAGANLGLNPGLPLTGSNAFSARAGTSFAQRVPGMTTFSRWVSGNSTVATGAATTDTWVTSIVGVRDSAGGLLGVDTTPELVERTQILDAAVDAQMDELESGAHLNDVFVWPPPAASFTLVTTGAESDD